MLKVMSSVYLISTFVGITDVMSFTISENKIGPRTVPLRDTSIDVQITGYQPVYHNSAAGLLES